MKRGEWHDVARFLRDQHPDWTNRQIAEACGVTTSAVSKALHPDRARIYNQRSEAKPGRRERKREFDRQWRATPEIRGRCANPCCSNLRGIGASLREPEGLCASCVSAIATVRRTLAEGMWADGWTVRELGEVFGVAKDRMGIHIAVWRSRGYAACFPHRRTPEQVERISAGWARTRAAA